MNYYNFAYRADEKTPLKLYSVEEGFIKGNMFSNIYEGYKNYKPKMPSIKNEQSAMMLEIQAYAAAAHDMNLYLDVCPNDSEAVKNYALYQKELKKAMEEYQEKYGPISLSSDELDKIPWGWDVTKWPWESDL